MSHLPSCLRFLRETSLSWKRRSAVCMLLAVFVFTTTYANELGPDVESLRREQLEVMKRIIDESSIEVVGEKSALLKRTEHPILRYTNPVTSSFGHGALFLLMNGKQPAAAVGVSCRDNVTFWWELTSLSTEPLKLTRANSSRWTPRSAAWKPTRVTDAPTPASSAQLRLTQMRNIARDFSVLEERREKWQEGRLLSQPLYRWSDERSGVLDATLFGYAETTDPEVLLQVEARRDPSATGTVWMFSLAKMTSAPVKVSFQGKEIWSVDGYWRGPRSLEDPYVEQALGQFSKN